MPKVTPPLTDEERKRIVEETKYRLMNRLEIQRARLNMKLPQVQNNNDDVIKEQL